MPSLQSETFASRLDAARNDDGGFGPRPGLASEAEPTALAAIALDDGGAREWLTAHQRPDGSLALLISDDERAPEELDNISATSLAAIALPPGDAREAALDYLIATPAIHLEPTDVVPMDTTVAGFSWTPFTPGWVDPTARGLLALQLLRPSATAAIDDAVALLADRSCVGGGWNYGNRTVWDTDLEPYAHTTAVALIGLQGAGDAAIVATGYEALRRTWPLELGGLSLAVTLAALQLADAPADELGPIETELTAAYDDTGFLDSVVALAWAAIATGEALETIRVAR